MFCRVSRIILTFQPQIAFDVINQSRSTPIWSYIIIKVFIIIIIFILHLTITTGTHSPTKFDATIT